MTGSKIWQARNFSLILLLVIIAVVSALLNPVFLTAQNVRAGLVTFFVELAIVTIGQTLLLLVRGIDLSVGGVVALSAVCVGFLHTHGLNIWLAMACGLVLGAGCGLLNGQFISRLKAPPIIVTLGSGILYLGITYGITAGRPYSDFPVAYQSIGQGHLGPIPIQVIVLAAIAAAAHGIMTYTRYGRWVYAIGGNETTARFSGIPVERTRLTLFTCSGLLAAITGIIMSARFLSAGPLLETGIVLETITAALLGGVSIAGGQGTIAGALLGMLVIAILENGLTLAQVTNSTQYMIIAGLLILVVGTEMFLSGKRIT